MRRLVLIGAGRPGHELRLNSDNEVADNDRQNDTTNGSHVL
jgi:hypothetical protein